MTWWGRFKTVLQNDWNAIKLAYTNPGSLATASTDAGLTVVSTIEKNVLFKTLAANWPIILVALVVLYFMNKRWN